MVLPSCDPLLRYNAAACEVFREIQQIVSDFVYVPNRCLCTLKMSIRRGKQLRKDTFRASLQHDEGQWNPKIMFPGGLISKSLHMLPYWITVRKILCLYTA